MHYRTKHSLFSTSMFLRELDTALGNHLLRAQPMLAD